MTAWDFPMFIVAAVAIAVAVAYLIMRDASAKRPPAYECPICGRRSQTEAAREWRFCPYCGAPKEAKSTADMRRKQ